MRLLHLFIALAFLFSAHVAVSETRISPGLMQDGSVTLVPDDEDGDYDEITVEALFSFESGESAFGINLCGQTDTVSVTLMRQTSDRFTDFEMTSVKATVTHGTERMLDQSISDGFGLSGGEINSLTVSIEDGRIVISGGYHEERLLFDRALSDFIPRSIRAFTRGKVSVSSLRFLTYMSTRMRLVTDHSLAGLTERFNAAHDPVEGFWKYLDRQNNPRYARLGGTYTLAVVADGDGGYDIIYLSGADVYADRWDEGMIKGHLRPTRFEGHYDLEWVDSTFGVHDRELSAQLDASGILTLNFPLLKTQIRLSRL